MVHWELSWVDFWVYVPSHEWGGAINHSSSTEIHSSWHTSTKWKVYLPNEAGFHAHAHAHCLYLSLFLHLYVSHFLTCSNDRYSFRKQEYSYGGQSSTFLLAEGDVSKGCQPHFFISDLLTYVSFLYKKLSSGGFPSDFVFLYHY